MSCKYINSLTLYRLKIHEDSVLIREKNNKYRPMGKKRIMNTYIQSISSEFIYNNCKAKLKIKPSNYVVNLSPKILSLLKYGMKRLSGNKGVIINWNGIVTNQGFQFTTLTFSCPILSYNLTPQNIRKKNQENHQRIEVDMIMIRRVADK